MIGKQDAQSRGAGRHRHRVAGQRSRLVDGAEGRELLHELAAASVGADRQPAADDLAVGGEVGLDAVEGGGAIGAQAEPGDDLVQDQQRAVPAAQLAQQAHELLALDQQARVGWHALDDHRCDLGPAFVHQRAQCLGVIERQHRGVMGEALRHPGRGRRAEGREPRPGVDQQMVHVPVVAAAELDDRVAAGGAACQADGGHDRFGAGGHEAHHLEVRHRGGHELGELDLLPARRPEREARGGSGRDRLHNLRVGVAEDQRAPRADVVHVAVGVDIDDVAAHRPLVEERLAADAAEGAHRRVHAGRHQLAGAAVELAGARPTVHSQPSASAMRPW